MEKTPVNFLDAEGRVLRWPKRSKEKLAVLYYVSSKFEANTWYDEKEVNAILMRWHVFGDHALLRRELYNNFLINRSDDCRKYWKESACDIVPAGKNENPEQAE